MHFTYIAVKNSFLNCRLLPFFIVCILVAVCGLFQPYKSMAVNIDLRVGQRRATHGVADKKSLFNTTKKQ